MIYLRMNINTIKEFMHMRFEDEKDFVHKLRSQTKFLLCCDSKTEAERFKKLLDDPEVIIITSDTDRYIAFDDS